MTESNGIERPQFVQVRAEENLALFSLLISHRPNKRKITPITPMIFKYKLEIGMTKRSPPPA